MLASTGAMTEMQRLIMQHDWNDTALGVMEKWPRPLMVALSIALHSRFPMVLWWGADLLMIYNDAWRPVLGTTRHPQFIGRPGRDAWPEIWHIIGPMLEGVMSTGEATWVDDQLLMVHRNGYLEEAYFTYSYSPILLETGQVGGVFSAVHETTQKVISDRRMQLLKDVAANATEVDPLKVGVEKMLAVLKNAPKTVPFVAIYSCSKDSVRLEGLSTEALRSHLPSSEEVARCTTMTDIDCRAWGVLSPAWDIPVTTALLLPLAPSGQASPVGVMLAGVNPCRILDDEYRVFFDLLATQIGSAMNSSLQYESQVKRAQMLAELDRAKTTFFHNISHEFRTPLTLILGPLEEWLGRQQSPQMRADLETAYRNVQRLLKLVNNLLDFARIEAGRYLATFVKTDVQALTNDLASAFQSAMEMAGLDYRVDVGPVSGDVYLDHDVWGKIVSNLLSNALKYTPQGEVRLRLEDGVDNFRVSVEDSGVGIPPEELPQLFQRFHRVQGTRGRTLEGSGIGLSLVRELVHLHGGEITVSSEPGHGSTFTVTMWASGRRA